MCHIVKTRGRVNTKGLVCIYFNILDAQIRMLFREMLHNRKHCRFRQISNLNYN